MGYFVMLEEAVLKILLCSKNHVLLESITNIQTKRKRAKSDLRKLLDPSWETD